MMPVPPVVSELYPPAPGVVRERPWWREGIDVPHFWEATRSDGVNLRGDANRDEALAEYDRKHPLPHPGFRAGQVWVVPDGATFSASVLVDDRVAAGRRVLVGQMRWDRFMVPEADLRREFSGAILLADPCCPWLAPWSPVAP